MKRRSSRKKKIDKRSALPSVTPPAATRQNLCSAGAKKATKTNQIMMICYQQQVMTKPSASSLTNRSNLSTRLYHLQKQEPHHDKQPKLQERSTQLSLSTNEQQLKVQSHLNELRVAHKRALITMATQHPLSHMSRCNVVNHCTNDCHLLAPVPYLSQTQQRRISQSYEQLKVVQQSHHLNKLRKAYQNALANYDK